jgi:uncharacterized protein (TIGR02145 family)
MKKILLCAAFIAASFTSIAQVGVGTATPDASAALDIESTTKGLLLPRLTTVQRDAIVSPVAGLAVYCIDCNSGEISFFNGSIWWLTSTGVVSRNTQVASDGSGGTYTFLNHNLGADTSLDPHTPVKGLNGDYYQWGRSGPAAEVDFIIGTWGAQGGTSADGNWTSSSKGPQDPCPTGYRVPSQTEWAAVNTNNTAFRTGEPWSSGDTEFGSALHYGPDASTKLLTLPAAGNRSNTNGALNSRGRYGYYWSSTENGSTAYNLNFNSSVVFPAGNTFRPNGFSVRCIAQ